MRIFYMNGVNVEPYTNVTGGYGNRIKNTLILRVKKLSLFVANGLKSNTFQKYLIV